MTARSIPVAVIAALLLALTSQHPAAQRPAPAAKATPPAQAPIDAGPERVDLDAVYRIKDEGLQRSQVMESAWYLTDVHAPLPAPLLAFPRAWTPGTNGLMVDDAVLAVIEREEDFKAWEGKLSGKIVLAQNPSEVRALFTPIGRRYTAQELADIDVQPVTAPRGGGLPPGASPAAPCTPSAAPPAPPGPPLAVRRIRFFAREGVVAVLEPGTGRGDHGALVVQGSNANRNAKEPAVAAQVVVADEIVMFGAHFGSWHAGTGATDNASGSATMMEAMRILKASGLRMRRTVRLALWTGEEQGYLGSTAYVGQQFADRDTMALQPAHSKLSAYFNMDNGTGAIRGVYLQGHESIRPIFAAWMEPFRSMGMTTLAIRNTGGTDHLPFNDVGLPGFQFVQDPVEYSTHFVYHAANRDSLRPRKPLPAPRRGRGKNITQ